MNKLTNKYKKGFTLIELLGAILILGIVLSISGYFIINTIKTSKETSTSISLSSLKDTARLYSIEYGENNWYTPTTKESILMDYNNIEFSCTNILLLKQTGYLKSNVTVKDYNDNTRILVIRDKNSLTILDEKIDENNENSICLKYDNTPPKINFINDGSTNYMISIKVNAIDESGVANQNIYYKWVESTETCPIEQSKYTQDTLSNGSFSSKYYGVGSYYLCIYKGIKDLANNETSETSFSNTYSINSVFKINLDANGGTEGTSQIYEKYNNGVYLDSATTRYKMTSSANPITKPTKLYTITYNENGTGITMPSSTSVSATFNGYNDGKTQMINKDGYITTNLTSTKYTSNKKLTAQWTNSSIKLPTISKDNYTCKWAIGSASGTQSSGGDSVTISSNTTFYAVCTPVTYTLTLDANGGTVGTSKIYEKYNTGVYLDSTATTKKMTSSSNPITKPTKSYTITYNANGQGATYTATPTSVSATFNGYYDGTTQMINKDGYITSSLTSTKYTSNNTLTAGWTNNSIKLPTISKSNYACYWAKDSTSGTQYSGGESVTISSNTTFYAVCTSNKYIIYLNTNGGTGGTSQIYEKYNSGVFRDSNLTELMTLTSYKISKPTKSYKINYYNNNQPASITTNSTTVYSLFNGYYTSSSGGTQLINANGYKSDNFVSTKFNSNTTLYAQWTNNTIKLPPITSNPGYNCNWAMGSSTGTQYSVGEIVTISSNKDFYVKCDGVTYTLTLDANGGTVGTSKIYEKYNDGVYLDSAATTYKMTSSSNPITKPTKSYAITYNANGTGITMPLSTSVSAPFSGYYDGETRMIDNNGHITSNFVSTKYTSENTLTAKWTNSTIKLPAISKQNYSCQWAIGSASGKKYSGETNVTISSDTTFYAVCTSNKYIIYLNANGGTGGTGQIYEKYNSGVFQDSSLTKLMTTTANPIKKPTKTYTITYDANGTGITMPSSTSSSATFAGFYTAESGGAQLINVNGYKNNSFTSTTFSSNKTLYAHWVNNSITLPTISKDNYSCKWAFGSTTGFKHSGGYSVTISSDTTFYAVCEPKVYTISFYNGGGTGTTDPIYEQYNTGIYLDSNLSKLMTEDSNSVSVPTPIPYTITYDSNNTGATYTASPTSSIPTFAGYNDSRGVKMIEPNGYITPEFTSTVYTEDTMLYAQWSKNTIILPEITKKGYSCKWAVNKTTGTPYSGGEEITISGDTKLYAVCSVNSYTVYLDGNGATTLGTLSVTANYNSAMPKISALPTKTGYTFKGYFIDKDMTYQSNGIPNRRPSASPQKKDKQFYNADGTSANTWNIDAGLTLYAKWQANTYTVTFDNQGATTAGTTSKTVTYDSTMPSITVPTKTGYQFMGYYSSTNGGGTKYYTSTGTSAMNWNIASNTKLYAYWIDKELPTCSISVTTSGIKLETSDNNGVASYGLTTSSTVTYNSVSKADLSINTFYGYVKDTSGNTNTCSVKVSSTHITQYYRTYKYCGRTLKYKSCYKKTINICTYNGGSSYTWNYSSSSYVNSCSSRCANCTCGSIDNGVGPGREQIICNYGNYSSCGSYYSYSFSTNHDYPTSCSVTSSFSCDINNYGKSYTSNCGGYTYGCYDDEKKISNDYCYKILN